MILMRINKVLGVCDIEPYNEGWGSPGGWFPIESLNFGFTPQDHSDGSGSENGEGSGNGGGGRGGNSGNRGGGASRGSAGNNSGESQDFTEMEISKAVDMSTVDMMQLAMEARGWSGGDGKAVVADIHFVGSIQLDESTHTHTFLRIHLDGVEIKQWGIQANADDRPTENFTLVYEKAAMRYETTDGRHRMPWVETGWNQTTNEPWKVQTDFYPDFPKPK